MIRKWLVVCVLALAGCVSVFLTGRIRTHKPPRRRDPAEILPQRQRQNRPTRSVSVREAKLQIQQGSIAGVPVTEAALVKPGAANISLPITFEPNVGQIDRPVQYVGRGNGVTVFLTSQEIAVSIARSARTPVDATNRTLSSGNSVQASTVSLRVAGNRGFHWKGETKLPAESNYFIGNDPKKWHTRVPHFARAETASSSSGIGMAVYGNEEGVEYDLRVPPDADVSKLRLTLAGARNLHLDTSGNLLMNVGADEIRMKKPTVYEAPHTGWHASGSRRHAARGARRARKYTPRRTQRTRGTRQGSNNARRTRRAANPCAPKLPTGSQTTRTPRDTPCPLQSGTRPRLGAQSPRKTISAAYVIEADGSIGFRIGPHDPHATLVVDPSLSVAYGTFLGGVGTDAAASIALDTSGKIYVGGTTTSTTFPGSAATRLGPADGPALFFIAKIDPTLTGASSLVYLTFFGGSGTQAGGLIAIDGLGDVAITGTTTATDFPVTDTSHPTSGLATGDGNDVVVSEIGPAGNNLVFSTLFGGSGTQSLGGSGGIALDSAGDVYIASDVHTTPIDSASADLPVTAGAFQTTWDGDSDDGFLAIFQPPATSGGAAVLKYCSYLGTNSNGQPGVGGIAVDTSGNAYIAGFTSNASNGFPTKNAIQSAYGGGTSDAFLMKISPVGGGATDLVYATLLGGTGADQALAVALDTANPPSAYVTGTTQSPNFPTSGVVGAYQPGLHANAVANAFLSVVAQNPISGQSSLAYSTYIGGSRTDAGQGVAVAAPNAVYLTGATNSPDMPWHDNLQAFNGAGDEFLAKLDPTSPGAASLIYVTPLGGTSPAGGTASAAGNAVAADQAGHVYVAGATTSADFPTAVTTEVALNGFQSSCASCQLSPPLSDAFVAEIAESASPMPSVYFNVGSVNFLPAAVGTSSVPQPVAVFNGGEASLSISGIEIAGSSASDFSLIGGTGCLSQALSPGPTSKCSFEVGFTPSTSGPEVAVVTVSDNAPGSPQVLELVSMGQAPLATFSPGSVNFGSQPEDSESSSQSIAMTNVGTGNITLVSITEAGPNAAQFPVSTGGDTGAAACQAGLSVTPGGQCVLKVAFTPAAPQTYNAEMDFVYNSGQSSNTEQTVPLTGVGTASAPLVSLAELSLVFGSQNVGTRSGTQSVTLTNQGSATLSITSIALTGTNASEFTIATAGTSCPLAGGTVIVQASCTVTLQFAPQTVGPKNASLSFTDNAAGNPQQVALSGTATAAPSLQVSPSSLTFVAQSENTSSTPQSVTIQNSGGAAAEVTGIAASGPNAGDFSSPASCTPNPVPAGGSCQIGVTFTPGAIAPGIRSATLNVPGGNPPTVTLSGTATQAGISVPTSVNFGSQLAGGAGGSSQPIVVTNSSSGPFAGALTITSVSWSGANAADFGVSGTNLCTGVNTAPGATCTIPVAFKPLQAATCITTGGSRTATMVLNDNAPGSPHSIPLSGTAMDFCVEDSPGQPVVEPITAGQSATYVLEIASSAGFAGSAGLACSVPQTLLGTCTVTTTPTTTPPVVQITAAAPGQFQVVVTTTAPGVLAAADGTRLATPTWPGSNRRLWLALLLLASVVIWAWALGRRRAGLAKLAQSAALLLACAMAIAACGGGGGATTPAAPAPGTPSGTYIITLTATVTPAGQPSVSRTFPLSLTVQ
jgi:hypothetical protein